MWPADSDQPVLVWKYDKASCSSLLGSLEAVEGTYEQRRLWSDCAKAQADLSLRWSHKSNIRFCRALAQFKRVALQLCFDWRLINCSHNDMNDKIMTSHYLHNNLIWKGRSRVQTKLQNFLMCILSYRDIIAVPLLSEKNDLWELWEISQN